MKGLNSRIYPGFSLILLLAFMLLKSGYVAGQIISYPNQYVLNPVLINPAFAGDRNALNIAGYYRQQWLGMKGAPDNLNLNADIPALKGKLGLGVQYVNERYGVSHLNKLSSLYAYRLKTPQGELGFGLGAGFITTRTAWSKLSADEPGDESFMVDSKNYILPEFSLGIKYTYKQFLAGFSIPELLSYEFNSDNKYSFVAKPSLYTYQLYGGNKFVLSPQYSLLASTLASYSVDDKLKFDFNFVASFSEKIWIGATYHTAKAISGLVQFGLSDQMLVAYSYQLSFGDISYASNGSHEFMLRYEFRYKANVASPLKF